MSKEFGAEIVPPLSDNGSLMENGVQISTTQAKIVFLANMQKNEASVGIISAPSWTCLWFAANCFNVLNRYLHYFMQDRDIKKFAETSKAGLTAKIRSEEGSAGTGTVAISVEKRVDYVFPLTRDVTRLDI